MQYYKHMSSMRHDKKIKKLFIKYGLKGYGLYNLILESITEKLCTEKPEPDLEENSEEIASFYNEDTTQINEMTCWMINEGLIELNEITKRIECKKIYKYLEQSQTRSEKIRDLISSYKDNAKKQLCLIPSQTVSNICDRKEQTRQDKTITEKEQIDLDKELIYKIIDYLNLKANTNYRSNSKKTTAFIKARLNENWSIDDFKNVIDNKCSQWIHDPKMYMYLRPETLFGTKFESYLNENNKTNIEKDNKNTMQDQDQAWEECYGVRE